MTVARVQKGGLIIDFLFFNPPNLAVNVQGEFFHYQQGAGVKARDVLARAQLVGQGITLIFIDETDIQNDVDYFVSEALQFRDHSQIGR